MESLLTIDFIISVLLVSIVGLVLKYRTPIPNGFIPVIDFVLGLLFAMLMWSWNCKSVGIAFYIDGYVFLFTIFGKGVLIAAIAAFGWDGIYGIWKYGNSRKRRKKA